MSLWETKTITVPDPVVLGIEKDVYDFVVQELSTYKQNPDNTRLDNSVVANLALFDLSALKYEKGYDQMRNLLADHDNQMVSRRMKQLLLTLYIRYTRDSVDAVSVSTLDGISAVFEIDPNLLAKLDSEYNVFWLQPFIRKAYNDIMFELNSSKQDQ